jgi:cytochrome c556
MAVHAQDAKAVPDTALAVRHIMQDLDKNMQAIAHGISLEDWETVAKLATLVADHPQPPLGEKLRILTYLGTDALSFKGHDQDAHDAAVSLREAAGKKDGAGVIAAYATIQNACLACHQSYRQPFLKHFYEK